jgi:hypothetical protein
MLIFGWERLDRVPDTKLIADTLVGSRCGAVFVSRSSRKHSNYQISKDLNFSEILKIVNISKTS